MRPYRLSACLLFLAIASLLKADSPKAASVAELDPDRFGIVVRGAAGGQGVLLPGVPGVHDAETQVRIAAQKAGLDPTAPLRISRFQVLKYQE